MQNQQHTIANNQINIQDLLWTGWKISAQTEEDLIFLGKTNLGVIAEYWTEVVNHIRAESKNARSTPSHGMSKSSELTSLIEAEKDLREAKQKVAYLKELIAAAKDKPRLARLRPFDWFKTGEDVIVYTIHPEWAQGVRRLKDAPAFVPSEIDFAHSGRGFVNIRANTPIHSNQDFLDGCGLSCDVQGPYVLRPDEFEGLKNDQEYLRFWLDNAVTRTEGLNKKRYIRELLGT